MKKMLWVMCSVGVLCSGPVLAQRQKSAVPDLNAEGKPGEIARAQFKKSLEKFDKVDENKDESISKDEATKHFSEYEMSHFADKDKDSNGKLSWFEYIGHDKWKKDALK